jgi:hypothetical protein
MRKVNNDTPAAYFSLMLPWFGDGYCGMYCISRIITFIESLSLTRPNPCLNPVTFISLPNKRLTRPGKAPGNPGRYRLGSLLFHSTRTTPTTPNCACSPARLLRLLHCLSHAYSPARTWLTPLSNRHWPTNCPLLLKLHLYLANVRPQILKLMTLRGW